MQIKNGSLHLFRLFGVNVFVHWSWALVAVYQIWAARNNRGIFTHHVNSIPFQIAIYLSLFLIVLIHEFGHALACKSVGGKAERIMLWPLGGVAFVQPPPRPGALLWSIAAGPLVNVILLPLTIVPAFLIGAFGGNASPATDFIAELALINAILLAFNMLPFYPLDGGQILQALAWFIFGRGTSLIIAASVGIIGAAVLAVVALLLQGPFLALIVIFMGFQSFRGLKLGIAMRRLENASRNPAAHCPACGQNPPVGNFWRCPCGAAFDTFAAGALCPSCNRVFEVTACPNCGQAAATSAWVPPVASAAPASP